MKRFWLKDQSVLDERETLEMYRIEHAGLYAMYLLLCCAVIVQMILGAPLAQMAGELLVIGAVSVGLIIAYARKGIWDAHSRPSVRGNAAYAAVSGVGVAVVVLGVRGSFLWGLAAGGAMFALCFALLGLMMTYVTRRQSREEEALEDEIDS